LNLWLIAGTNECPQLTSRESRARPQHLESVDSHRTDAHHHHHPAPEQRLREPLLSPQCRRQRDLLGTGHRFDHARARYPRSELRETQHDGTLDNWLHASSDSYLSAVLRIDQVPSLNKVVIGQIHSTDVPGSQNDPLVKLQYHYRRGVGRLELLLRDQPGDTAVQNILLAENVQLGERFGYDLRITPSGLMLIS